MYYISDVGIVLGLDGKIVDTMYDTDYKAWIRDGEIPEPLVCFDALFGADGWKLREGKMVINSSGIAKILGSN